MDNPDVLTLFHRPSVWMIRDRPFNLKGGYGFLFRSENIFRTTQKTRVRIFIVFFQNLTLGYMTKTLNQMIFFSSTKIRIFFSATLGIRIFFLEKKTYPPPPFQVKWSFPKDFCFSLSK